MTLKQQIFSLLETLDNHGGNTETMGKIMELAGEMEGRGLGEWQLCPKCNGQGTVGKPPYLPVEVTEWASTSVAHQCDVCNGNKIIARPTPQPPLSLPEGIVEQLEKENPYKKDEYYYVQKHQSIAWKNCVSTLRRITGKDHHIV